MDEWIVIPGWDKWQSRRDRHDPWIKDYVDQLSRDEYLQLTSAQRGVLHDVRLLYSLSNGQLRTSSVPGLILQKVPRKTWEALNRAGFIQLSAAKPPPIRGLEVEVDKEKAFEVKGEDQNQRPLDFASLLRNMPK